MSSGLSQGPVPSGGGRGFTLSVVTLAPPTSPQVVHLPFEGTPVHAGPGW